MNFHLQKKAQLSSTQFSSTRAIYTLSQNKTQNTKQQPTSIPILPTDLNRIDIAAAKQPARAP